MSRHVGFNYTEQMRRVCEIIAQTVPEFGHVDMSCMAVSFSQARSNSSWGTFASLTPLRFEHGKKTSIRRGREYMIQPVLDSAGREMLYILTIYLPRFHNQSFQEKLITIFHELWHVSPEFNGDIRRHAGRCYAHTGSQKKYDAHMDQLVQRWLALHPPNDTLLDFLRDDFTLLQRKHGGVYGTRLSRPKLIPINSARQVG
jgi:hypothetical protein